MDGSGLGIGFINRGANRPATAIAWNEAARFANWLNADKAECVNDFETAVFI